MDEPGNSQKQHRNAREPVNVPPKNGEPQAGAGRRPREQRKGVNRKQRRYLALHPELAAAETKAAQNVVKNRSVRVAKAQLRGQRRHRLNVVGVDRDHADACIGNNARNVRKGTLMLADPERPEQPEHKEKAKGVVDPARELPKGYRAVAVAAMGALVIPPVGIGHIDRLLKNVEALALLKLGRGQVPGALGQIVLRRAVAGRRFLNQSQQIPRPAERAVRKIRRAASCRGWGRHRGSGSPRLWRNSGPDAPARAHQR